MKLFLSFFSSLPGIKIDCEEFSCRGIFGTYVTYYNFRCLQGTLIIPFLFGAIHIISSFWAAIILNGIWFTIIRPLFRPDALFRKCGDFLIKSISEYTLGRIIYHGIIALVLVVFPCIIRVLCLKGFDPLDWKN
jgi:hypothetical protein